MPNSDNQRSGNGLKTAATFGIGALVGALAAGAAWYFSEEEPQPRHAHQHYSSNHPVNQTPSQTDTGSVDKTEKDGSQTMCEICFVGFAELKECEVPIVSTPCGHVYCRDCVVGALNIKPECPHCRNEVHEGQLRRLYL